MKKILLLLPLLLIGCDGFDTTYTLYRSSAGSNKDMRIHVATFDAKESESYNRENCQITEELFQKQPGVTVKYWCEKGKFKK